MLVYSSFPVLFSLKCWYTSLVVFFKYTFNTNRFFLTHFKRMTQMFISWLIHLSNHHHNPVLEHSHHSKKVSYAHLPFHTVHGVLKAKILKWLAIPFSGGSWKKQESSRKTSISALLTMPKAWTVWITINCGKFWKRWEYQTTWPVSWEICMQVRKQQLELDMEQETGSK